MDTSKEYNVEMSQPFDNVDELRRLCRQAWEVLYSLTETYKEECNPALLAQAQIVLRRLEMVSEGR